MPQPPDTSKWNEYDWEQYLRESDRYAAHFFGLLKRFCDLPSAREIINQKLEREFKGRLLDCNFNCENCESRWNCEFSTFSGDEDGEPPPDTLEMDDFDDGAAPVSSTFPPEPGNPLYYEAHPAFVMLRQTALGWCNVYAAILPADVRPLGLKVLFHIGRALANLAYSIADGMYAQPPASLSMAKRSLDQLNTAMGEVQRLRQEKPRLAKILEAIEAHLMRSQESIEDHLHACRKRLGDTGKDGAPKA